MVLVLELELQKKAYATLVLFVDEVLAVAEVAVRELGLLHGWSLGHRHLVTIQGDEDVLRGVWLHLSPGHHTVVAFGSLLQGAVILSNVVFLA